MYQIINGQVKRENRTGKNDENAKCDKKLSNYACYSFRRLVQW